jgi:hypothetical protein
MDWRCGLNGGMPNLQVPEFKAHPTKKEKENIHIKKDSRPGFVRTE